MNSAISKKPAKTCQIQFLQMSQLLATHLNSPSTKTQKNATSFRGFNEVIFGGIVCKVIHKYCFFFFCFLIRQSEIQSFLLDHIQHNHYLLNRNNLKRSSYPHSHPQNKIQRPSNKGHHLQTDFINMVFQNILKLYCDLKFQLEPLYGNSRVLKVRTFFISNLNSFAASCDIFQTESKFDERIYITFTINFDLRIAFWTCYSLQQTQSF